MVPENEKRGVTPQAARPERSEGDDSQSHASWLNTELDHKPALSAAEWVRTITRPVLTIGGAAVWVWFIVAEVNYPPAFQWLIIASWLEWFGERAVKRLTELGGKQP